jgi:transposase
MPRPIGPRKIFRYSEEFKATAVALSSLDGVAVQDVARELDIHPFMLSRWRKHAREGKIVAKKPKLDEQTTAQLKELRELKKQHKRLQLEHAILKKAIRFSSERRQRSSPSWKRTEPDSPSE